MFRTKSDVFSTKSKVSWQSLLVVAGVSLSIFSSAAAQSQVGNVPENSSQPIISHTLFRVSIIPVDGSNSDQEAVAREGDLLNIGDTVRTGEDSIARIYFPDGTTETLCENTSYRVLESGSEVYDEDDDPNIRENIVAAFKRCGLRPRFLTRCRDQGGFITKLPKAGERGRVGQDSQNSGGFVVKDRSAGNVIEVTDALNETENGKFKRSDFSSRCSRGEELFANFIFIPESVTPEPIAAPVQNPVVPEPPEEPITVPEAGSSPL